MAAITRREYSGNAAKTTLASDISNSDTSIAVDDGSGFPTGTNPFFIVIGRGTSTEEKVLCSGRSGNTITASSRGADDTSAASHDAGEAVEHVWAAQDADDVNRVAAALTTKGDLLGFGTEPTRVPVGADDTILVADSADAEGVSWQSQGSGSGLDADTVDGTELADIGAALVAKGSTEVASYTVSSSATWEDVASVTLTIAAGWGGWDIDAAATLAQSGLTNDYRIVIDGVNQQVLEDITDQPVSVVARGTGSSTGSVVVKLQIRSNGTPTLTDVALVVRADRTS